MVRPLFGAPAASGHALIGMVHLGPLLERGVRLADVEAAARRDAQRLAEAGFDAIMVENFGDRPFYPDRVPTHTVTAMTRMVLAIRHEIGDLPLGVNVLRNDARSALSIAAATDAAMIRVNVHIGSAVTDQGLIHGQAHDTVRIRRDIAPQTRILADVRVKHAAPLAERPVTEEAEELTERGEADALIVSGHKTGGATDPERLRQVRDAVHCPVLVGSGASIDQLGLLLPVCDGLIVGSSIKEGGAVLAPVDPVRARAFVMAVRGLSPS